MSEDESGITQFPSPSEASSEPVQSVIDLFESLLESAKKGEISAAIVFGEKPTGGRAYGSAGMMDLAMLVFTIDLWLMKRKMDIIAHGGGNGV